jgi:exodeoxyribonuclease-1
MFGVWPGVFAREDAPAATDVDEDLYGGFLNNDDRRLLQRLREVSPAQWPTLKPRFHDERLDELSFRYRARNFSDTLSPEEQARWAAHRRAWLHEGAGGRPTVAQWLDRVDLLNEAAEQRDDERAQSLLSSLVDWAEAIAPEL